MRTNWDDDQQDPAFDAQGGPLLASTFDAANGLVPDEPVAAEVVTLPDTNVDDDSASLPGGAVAVVAIVSLSVVVDKRGSGSHRATAPVGDTTPPAVVGSIDDNLLASGDVATLMLRFSEPVRGFDLSDLRAAHGELSDLLLIDDGRAWSVQLRPVGGVESHGDTVTVDLAGLTDVVGNRGVGTVVAATYAVDTRPPLATLTLSDDLLQAGETATLTVRFNEPVLELAASDFYQSAGVLEGAVSDDGGRTWYAAFTPRANFRNAAEVVMLKAGVVRDAAGNANPGPVPSNAFALATDVIAAPTDDGLPPTATMTFDANLVQVGRSVPLTVRFSKPVTGFGVEDLQASMGTLTPPVCFDGGWTWGASFTLGEQASGSFGKINLNLAGVKDLVGRNGIGVLSSDTYVVGSTPVSLRFDPLFFMSDSGPNRMYRYMLTSNVDDVITADDIQRDGGARSIDVFFARAGELRFNVYPERDDVGVFRLVVPTDTVHDASAVSNVRTETRGTFDTLTFPIADERPELPLVLGVPRTGWHAQDYTINLLAGVRYYVGHYPRDVGRTLSAGDPTIKLLDPSGVEVQANAEGAPSTIEFTPVTSGAFTLRTEVGSAGYFLLVTDSEAAASDVSVDVQNPTLSIGDNVEGIARGPVRFEFNFDEPVFYFFPWDVYIDGGIAGAWSVVDQSRYLLEVMPSSDGEGDIRVEVPAGVVYDVATHSNGVAAYATQAFDMRAPRLDIQDPIREPASGEFVVRFTFSEPVTGFGVDDVAVIGAQTGEFTGSGAAYSLTLLPPTGRQGTIDLNVAAGAASDAAGNQSLDASRSILFDTTPASEGAPSIRLVDDAPGVAGSVVHYSIAFDAPVSGFALDDIRVVNGVASALIGSDDMYWLRVLPTPDFTGVMALSVAPNAAQTASGAGSLAVAVVQAVDTIAPTVSISDDFSAIDAGVPQSLRFRFLFSEPVTEFGADDVAVLNASKGEFSGSGCDYSLSVTTLPGAGHVQVSIAAGAARDEAGNASLASEVARQSYRAETLDLGDLGQLISPVSGDGGWFYYWDRNSNNTQDDQMDHDTLDAIFRYAADGTPGSGESDAQFRFAEINGYRLALPEAGETPVTSGSRPSTSAYGSAINLTYDGLLALWDAGDGAPYGWDSHLMHSATPTAEGHALVSMSGYVQTGWPDTAMAHVALQVY